LLATEAVTTKALKRATEAEQTAAKIEKRLDWFSQKIEKKLNAAVSNEENKVSFFYIFRLLFI
jgi:hypothetical protein